MVDRAERPDARLEQRIDQAGVVIQALLICWAGAARLNARPGDGEAIALQVELLHNGDVFSIAVVVVAGNIGRGRTTDLAGCVHETVPNGLSLPVFIPSPLDLKGCCRRSPKKSLGERAVPEVACGLRQPAVPRVVLRAIETGGWRRRR